MQPVAHHQASAGCLFECPPSRIWVRRGILPKYYSLNTAILYLHLEQCNNMCLLSISSAKGPVLLLFMCRWAS